MKTGNDYFNVKAFVESLLNIGVKSSSKAIAAFLTRKGHPVSPGIITSIKAHITRSRKL